MIQRGIPVNSNRITFSFGENWLNYLEQIDQSALDNARDGLAALLPDNAIEGKSFLDIGCGSGIHSLAATQLGASSIISIDVDPASVAACRQTRQQLGQPDGWQIHEGSILDQAFVDSLPTAEIVYSWGVLHHTGDMWTAISNASSLVKTDGLFAIAIYNKTSTSRFWLWYKRLYNRSNALVKQLLVWALVLPRAAVRLLRGKSPLRSRRGMSVYYDAIDWAGGLPYEYATFDEIADFCRDLGFRLVHSTRTSATGCNEFVFRKE